MNLVHLAQRTASREGHEGMIRGSTRGSRRGGRSDHSTDPFTANGRTYRPPPRPIVVICFDGCADEYLSASVARGRMPNTLRLSIQGYRGLARAALPSFTNVNNASIVTGVPPSVTGICGNFFLDPETGEEVMMNSSRYLRCETLLAAAARSGRRVAVVTAKDKLRDLLSHELEGIAFSSEKAADAREETHGISRVEELVGHPTPEIYSPEASLFVLRAGVSLLERGLADFLYLSLTDYMQHRYSPEEPESLDFHEGVDREIGNLLELDAVLGVTADHGMNGKTTLEGEPRVIHLESVLRREVGDGVRVICPITDPYVVHHGALGSAVTVYLEGHGKADIDDVRRRILEIDGITEVHDRASAARKLELPAERIGDLFVLSGRDVVVGRTPEHHDLSALRSGLRSHGGRYEEMVPLLLSKPLNEGYAARAAGDPRNFDIFDFTCNGGLS
ncbi:MAG: phosphonoacetate hydrolase [Planctomycetota bacterium]|nr:phosphonoacetate hydrolase [Planctomycetota bacterium]